MAFSLVDAAETFTWPIDIKVPAKDGGFAKKSFDATLKILDPETLDSFTKGVGSSQDDEAMCRHILVDWDEKTMADEDGNALPFSERHRDQLIKIPYVRTGIIQSYYRAMNGSAREKN